MSGLARPAGARLPRRPLRRNSNRRAWAGVTRPGWTVIALAATWSAIIGAAIALGLDVKWPL